MIKLLVLTGPTASGKSALALELAQKIEAQIICADSRQIYRGLDVGTAKPSARDRRKIEHHLIDIVDPGDRYNAGIFAKDAGAVIRRLGNVGENKSASSTAIVCGGTGFYLEALLRPLFEEPESSQAARLQVRADLQVQEKNLGLAAMHARLKETDPPAAARIHPHDAQRIIRALEIFTLSGKTMTELQQKSAEKAGEPEYCPFTVVLDQPISLLKERIQTRTRKMLDGGWVEEVEALLCDGLPEDAPGFESLGYREIISLIRSEITEDQVYEQINRKSWQYAKRQRTWNRSRPHDLLLESDAKALDKIIEGWIKHCAPELRGALK